MKTWYNDATTNFQTFRNETVEDRPTMPIAHTPGPWEYGRMLVSPKAKDRRCGFVVNGPDTPDDLPTRICDLRVPQGFSGFAEGEANARLIAAAPEMLDCLVSLLDWCREHTSPTQQNTPHDLLVAAHHAIAKATN